MGRLPLAIMLVAVLVGACAKKGGDGGPSPASTDAQPAPPASGANGASGANAAGSDSQAGAATAPAKGAAADKAAAAKHLKAGRALAKKKEWKAAVAELQQATAAAPDEPAAWSELGWTAFQADDLDLAESANRKAVELATADKHKGLKAASPYNLGRIAEKRGNKDAAKERYGESLVLRPNAAVEQRLVALGGTPPASSADEAARRAAPPTLGEDGAATFVIKGKGRDLGPWKTATRWR